MTYFFRLLQIKVNPCVEESCKQFDVESYLVNKHISVVLDLTDVKLSSTHILALCTYLKSLVVQCLHMVQ